MRWAALPLLAVWPAWAAAEAPWADILAYADCAGAADGYHKAAEPYADGTLLIDLHNRDMAAIQSALSDAQWQRFQSARAAGERDWWARMAVLQALPMDSSIPEPATGPSWSREAEWSWQCGELRIRLAEAGILPE